MPSVETQTPCPSADILELVALGRGSTDQVRFHVEKCDSCRALVDEIRTNEEFLASFRPAMGPRGSGLGRGGSGAGSGAVGGGSGGSGGNGDGLGGSLPGTVEIPGYHNAVEISRGGQGIVYRCVHTLTKRKVAVKMLLRGAYASPRELHRFEREIEIVAALRHPHIVTVFDSGVTPDARPFVVMEYIHGLPLDKYVKEKLSRASRRTRLLYEGHLRLFAMIATGVQHAHSRGVIHRDLKPGNILVDDAGEPHIVDFGMARALSVAHGPTPTMTHEFGGTLAYASPEQVSGDPERIDVRTDVYSLGVILYEMLTGSLPYSVSGPISEVVRNIESAEPVAPSTLEPTIGYEVETIILKALAKEPDRRYQSAGELARDVEDFLEGRPISARSDSAWYVMRKMARRHKSGVIAAGVIGVLVCGTGVAAYVADRAGVREEGVREGLRRLLASTQIASGDKSPKERFREILDAGDREITPAFGAFPKEEAEVREHVGYGYWEAGEHAKAEAQFKRVLELRTAAGAPLAETAGLRIRLARVCAEYPGNRFDDAKGYLDLATIDALRGAGEKRLLAEALRTLGPIEARTDMDGAVRMLEEARGIALGLPEAGEMLDAIDDSLAWTHFAKKEYRDALGLYQGLYERFRARHGERHMETAMRLESIADCELFLDMPADALDHYLAVQDVYKRILIPPDVRLRKVLLKLKEASKELGKTAEAEAYGREAEAMKAELERRTPGK